MFAYGLTHITVAFQGGNDQLLKVMEERMMDVEQKLRLVKRLLQDKVNQLKEQVSFIILFLGALT